MKKAQELTLASKENDSGPPRKDLTGSGKTGAAAKDNIYTDTIKALLEKNRSRVARYYCVSRKCPRTFWDADLGFTCPDCGTYGIISTFKADTAYDPGLGKQVVGYLDSIGRLFCPACTQRFGFEDDVGLVIYKDSEPYCSEVCEACRTRLDSSS